MTDFNELMKQAQQMQEQFKEAQLNLVSLIVEGQSGAGLVSIKINGRHDVVGVSLDDSIMSEDKSFVEDLIAAAFNDAVRKLEDKSKETMGSMASGFKLPEGFKFPF
ncbi:MAG TPA: YbaB/EbfC family nucleoid-associated protein [Gammaproteobacteria bacterium]|nr:YbaB/EbfC family nucleoid-associated protein [Gammaproteobacteria bacterium]HAO87997.1 YbaB/EbfC family nucleoid-associated protein [Gammaproteobacteria bacterium]HBJ88786.1 YbaB/EbfC family nucleoid-associated protein [Gammaproteobacteria bacterium]HCI88082.1 YbaB/EbfC family nucleoid-associated protein [Gammaproteobacteria bacterium]HCL72121.1 YbaB/EbfC family nucleoid-associated protein [Gammaproteobacteria bacterium]|tara:strand:- start:568 stop:888 length:321 start_codon:yes stop_codon:yes gene_type:complete